MLVILAALALLVARPAPAATPEQFQDSLLTLGSGSLPVNAQLLEATGRLYQDLDYQLIWQDAQLLEQLEEGIAQSYVDGLNPSDYAPGTITDPGSYDQKPMAQDIATTIRFFTLLNHLYYGKVSPTSLKETWNIEDLRKLDEDRNLIINALRAGNVTGLFAAARPEQDIYEDLKAGLAYYRNIQAEGGWPEIQLNGLLKPGEQHILVPQLRQRLAIEGDYKLPQKVDEPERYDADLAAAVKRFQLRHLLGTDGIIGPATLSAMNRPVQEKIDQLRANLERMRWFLKGLGDDFLLVDIAGYELYLVQDDAVTWSSPIQVGKPYRQTPVLKSAIAYLEWNPTWTVPPTILNQDVLPAIRQDSDYLERNHMDVLSFQGHRIDPATIDWQLYPGRSFPYMIRQRPGPWNALGTVKFIFPNDHLVYLHDTPSKYLFEHSNRAFSSGCIRVAKPYELAEILLATPGEGGYRAIQDLLESGETRRQYLPKPYPVALLYWTTKLLPEGDIVFTPDVYGRDGRILAALND